MIMIMIMIMGFMAGLLAAAHRNRVGECGHTGNEGCLHEAGGKERAVVRGLVLHVGLHLQPAEDAHPAENVEGVACMWCGRDGVYGRKTGASRAAAGPS